MKEGITTKDVVYNPPVSLKRKQSTKSIEVIGLDTEALTTGQMFMFCTGKGGVFTPEQFPHCFFTREYRGSHFVTYNLKYDEGAFLQVLPVQNLKQLWKENRTEYDGYTYKCVPKKLLCVSKGKNSIHIWDMATFFMSSLNKAAKEFLGEEKIDVGSKDFTPERVEREWNEIALYCIQDAKLVERLAQSLIRKFEQMGVYPTKLYSTAYASWQYFTSTCDIPTVKRFWEYDKGLLDYAMLSYNGGKFEVTEKGVDDYWEYDINSAYPYEIANLLDISNAEVIKSDKYQRRCDYGFLLCEMSIPVNLYHPVAIKRNGVNVYPSGCFQKVITKQEYDYFRQNGIKPTILQGYWLNINKPVFPFREAINHLYTLKSSLKGTDDKITYHLVKILLNSLYGKFCQLIDNGGKLRASGCWNPIYASIITANTRIKVSKMQQQYPSIVATFTDSIISTTPLPIESNTQLGEFAPASTGKGVIVGSGVYQIGEKVKFRGFEGKFNLMELLSSSDKTIDIETVRPYTWRETIFHNWDKDLINRFTPAEKSITPNFDSKRIWLDDYTSFKEVLQRKVESLPLVIDEELGWIT